MKKTFTILTLLFTGFQVLAQEETPEMITDRPDATESPTPVPKGFLQLETGAYYNSFEENTIKTETVGYNTSLFRYGLLDNFELRLGVNFEETRFSINDVESDDVASGFSPLLFGFKIAVLEEKGWVPEIGILGHLYLPFTSGEDYKPETTGADFRFSFAHILSEKSSIGYNLGAQWGNDSRELAYVYTLSYGYSVSKKIGVYAEVYGDLPENSQANHFWDAGLTYSIKPNIQLDATIGKSITEGQDLLLSTGVSVRLPN